jgi:cysteine-rich repeat protein
MYALEDLRSVGTVEVTRTFYDVPATDVTSAFSVLQYDIQFTATNFPVNWYALPLLVVDESPLRGADTVTVEVTAEALPIDDVIFAQQVLSLTVSNSSADSRAPLVSEANMTLSFENATTAVLPVTASASDVYEALRDLPGIGRMDVHDLLQPYNAPGLVREFLLVFYIDGDVAHLAPVPVVQVQLSATGYGALLDYSAEVVVTEQGEAPEWVVELYTVVEGLDYILEAAEPLISAPEPVAIAVVPLTHICGNAIRTSAELCDDGNTLSGDGCSASCVVEANFVCVNRNQFGEFGDVDDCFFDGNACGPAPCGGQHISAACSDLTVGPFAISPSTSGRVCECPSLNDTGYTYYYADGEYPGCHVFYDNLTLVSCDSISCTVSGLVSEDVLVTCTAYSTEVNSVNSSVDLVALDQLYSTDAVWTGQQVSQHVIDHLPSDSHVVISCSLLDGASITPLVLGATSELTSIGSSVNQDGWGDSLFGSTLSGGAIAGIVIAVVLIPILILAFMKYRKYKRVQSVIPSHDLDSRSIIDTDVPMAAVQLQVINSTSPRLDETSLDGKSRSQLGIKTPSHDSDDIDPVSTFLLPVTPKSPCSFRRASEIQPLSPMQKSESLQALVPLSAFSDSPSAPALHPKYSELSAPKQLARLRKQLKISVLSTPGGSGSNWTKLFKSQYDVNHDGIIDLDEFRAVIRSDHHSWTRDLPEHLIVAAFNQIDTDHSGGIELSEFLAWFDYKPSPGEVANHLGTTASRLGTIFRQNEDFEKQRHEATVALRKQSRQSRVKLSNLRRALTTNDEAEAPVKVSAPGATDERTLLEEMELVGARIGKQDDRQAELQSRIVQESRKRKDADKRLRMIRSATLAFADDPDDSDFD